MELLYARLGLQVELLEGVVFISHHFALAPLLEPGSVILSLVAPEQILQSANVLQAETIEAEFKIDQRVVLMQAVNELAPDLLVQFIVAEVQTEQGLVARQRLNHFFNTAIFFAVMGQIVGFEVEGPKRLVLSQGYGEDSGSLQAKAVAFELELAQRFVAEEHASQVLPLLILDALPVQVQSLERIIVTDHFGENEATSGTHLHTTK